MGVEQFELSRTTFVRRCDDDVGGVRSLCFSNKPGAIPFTNSADAVEESMAVLVPRTPTSKVATVQRIGRFFPRPKRQECVATIQLWHRYLEMSPGTKTSSLSTSPRERS
ncbi:hypothetical protein M409DRAFT_60536 [Zasmidium cellare ATCC 36951]|uniref:Uncharacterized protein n=1 Tax=Zasmidium cellare ATCC 36951 TaxID=1080233 RepID=A0A6A6BYS8_ZASCE|nr:uncharacterized protein M409DRAFT_60536 [Zasmidium cellare ATCC 36951]KAF2159763.1 hypothetical protein M409DRAFT_60536 [Zasmidium cellare ATCC 36951]